MTALDQMILLFFLTGLSG